MNRAMHISLVCGRYTKLPCVCMQHCVIVMTPNRAGDRTLRNKTSYLPQKFTIKGRKKDAYQHNFLACPAHYYRQTHHAIDGSQNLFYLAHLHFVFQEDMGIELRHLQSVRSATAYMHAKLVNCRASMRRSIDCSEGFY